MLFTRLYNWIKRKTLPSSFLFKNRLFIERDSKTRRIFTNFGLVYRNSKWSNYEKKNISTSFVRTFNKKIFYIFLFSFIFFIFLSVYPQFNFFSKLIFKNLPVLFWMTIDASYQFFLYSFWVLYASTLTLLSSFYLNIIWNSTTNENKNNLNSINVFKSIKNSFYLAEKNYLVSKNDLNFLTLFWLNNSNLSEIEIDEIDDTVEVLFDTNFSKLFWNLNFNIYVELYKSNFFLNLIKFNTNLFYNKPSLSYLISSNPKSSLPSTSSLVFNNFKIKSYFDFNNFFYNKNVRVDQNTEWSIDSSFLDSINNFDSLFLKKGPFFLSNSSLFNTSNNFFMSEIIKNELIFSKWNRWLYRYSLLHRKSVKFAQKLSFIKKLINTGFYNSTIFKKNIWNSNYFNSKNLKSTQLTTYFDSYFDSFFYMSKLNSFSSTSNLADNVFNTNASSLNNFKSFENSYFWYLKRFFIFNSLSNNNSKLFYNLKNVKNDLNFFFNDKKDNKNFLNLFINFSLTNKNFFFQPFFLNYNKQLIDTNLIENDVYNDLNLNLNELDLFSKENLVSLQDVSNSSSLNFFKHNSISVISDLNIPALFFKFKKINTFNDLFFVNYSTFFFFNKSQFQDLFFVLNNNNK